LETPFVLDFFGYYRDWQTLYAGCSAVLQVAEHNVFTCRESRHFLNTRPYPVAAENQKGIGKKAKEKPRRIARAGLSLGYETVRVSVRRARAFSPALAAAV